MTAALATPEIRIKLATAGFSAAGSTPAELEALTAREYERFGRVAREAGVAVE